MIWSEFRGNWRDNALPAQKQYAAAARAISEFENVTMLVSSGQYKSCRAVSWKFNARGGDFDGLLPSWENDDLIAEKICEITGTDYYRTDDFVLEGGSIHVDGEGTVLTTKMCLLSEGRNPSMTQSEIEEKLLSYLGCEKVLRLSDGIDPDETNGHIDDVACFVRPGEVCCIDTDDEKNPFYAAAKRAQSELGEMTDARG